MYATLFIALAKAPNHFIRHRKVVFFVLSALGVGLLRNNGFYIVLFSLPFISFFFSDLRQRIAVLIAACMVITAIPLTNGATMIATNAKPGSVKEMLSIPFQQTALYAIRHSKEVSLHEQKIIDSVLGYDSLPDRYIFYLSDPVKNPYKSDGNLVDYFFVWANQGLSHPLTYIDAAALQTYGYWSIIEKKSFAWGYVSFGNDPGIKLSPVFSELSPWISDEIRSYAIKVISLLSEAPIITLLLQPGTYTWILLLSITYLVYKKRTKYAIAYLPCILLLATCLLSPVNGYMRYAIGIAATMPITLYSAFVFGNAKVDDLPNLEQNLYSKHPVSK